MWSCTLTVLLATGLAWFNPITADVNSTLAMEAGKYLCAQGARINCTDTLTEPPQLGHFSKCPEMFRDYCIEGECRFIQSEQQPSCVCKFGFVGSRCQLVDMFYLTGKQDKFIIVGLILTIRFCRKHKARRKQGEEVEALSSKPLGGKDLRGEDEDTPMTTLA
ncbi:probetacellulin-like isoform X2 [Scyliorhinus canicula]|uniref:probetacellulin-like isoform X2 n=1 Tax=Scyliorhinus canicula TaxID=7830 RepID=UPI0018F4F5C6|nr:probetacellulin-like isoform X2 [Scyliorhinus canicula]